MSDPLSRNALVVTFLEAFEMVIVIICKKVCRLTDREFTVACSIVLGGFGDVSWSNVWCNCLQLSILQRKCALQFWTKWLLDKEIQHNPFWTMKFFFSSRLLLINSGQFINQCFCLHSQQHGSLSSFVDGKYIPLTIDLNPISCFLNSLSPMMFVIGLKYSFTRF